MVGEEEEEEEKEKEGEKVKEGKEEKEEEEASSNFPVRLLTPFKHVSAAHTLASLLEHLSRVCRVLSCV